MPVTRREVCRPCITGGVLGGAMATPGSMPGFIPERRQQGGRSTHANLRWPRRMLETSSEGKEIGEAVPRPAASYASHDLVPTASCGNATASYQRRRVACTSVPVDLDPFSAKPRDAWRHGTTVRASVAVASSRLCRISVCRRTGSRSLARVCRTAAAAASSGSTTTALS